METLLVEKIVWIEEASTLKGTMTNNPKTKNKVKKIRYFSEHSSY